MFERKWYPSLTEREIADLTFDVDDDIERARALAADAQYSDSHKQTKIAEMLESTASQVEWRIGSAQERIDKDAAAWDRVMNVPLDPANAAALAYTRDAITARLEFLPVDKLFAEWDDAIARGDKTAIRVWQDYGESWVRSKLKTPPNFEAPAGVMERIERGQLVGLSAEDRQLAERVKTSEARRQDLERLKANAVRKLRSVRVVGGELVHDDDGERAIRNRTRRSF